MRGGHPRGRYGGDFSGGRVGEEVIFEVSKAVFSPSGSLLGRLELPEGRLRALREPLAGVEDSQRVLLELR
jgi:hypothetical protein